MDCLWRALRLVDGWRGQKPVTRGKKEWIANGMLAASAGMTCLAVPFSESFAGGFLFHTALAATVGGIADWFAVNSLFRKPLGISFRTELVLKNREKIIHMAREMIEREILTIPRLYQVLKQHSAGAAFLSWLLTHKGEVEAFLTDAICLAIERGHLLPAARLGQQAMKEAAGQLDWGDVLGCAADRIDEKVLFPSILPVISKAAHTLGDTLCSRELLSSLYQEAWKQYEEKNKSRAMLKGLLESQMGLSDDKAVSLIQGKVRSWLDGLSSSDSPESMQVFHLLEEMRGQLAREKEWQETAGGRIRRQVLVWLDEHGNDMAEALLRDHALGCARKIASYIVSEVLSMLQDPDRRLLFDRWLLKRMAAYLPWLHERIGESVEHVLEGYSGEEMSQMAEASVSHDLQMIRVNGSLVGAMLGGAAYLLFFILSGGGTL